MKRPSIDPLFQMFEHFLLTRSYEDSAAFTKQLAEQYLAYIDSTSAHIPLGNRSGVLEDLNSEVHEMLVKKMYGCVKPADYANFGRVIVIKKGDEVKAFDFSPQAVQEGGEKRKS